MVFNTEGSYAALQRYLGAHPFREVYLTLFSHGVRSIGLPSVADWRRLVESASRRSGFLGVDEKRFPHDFAVFVRYHDDLIRTIADRHPWPPPLSLKQVNEFLQRNRHRYPVEWIPERHPAAA